MEKLMKSKNKLVLGSFLTIFGGLGMILGPSLGFTELEGPWSFIAGFLSGIAVGTGVALVISGLISNRKK